MSKEAISTPNAPAAIGAYSQAIKANGFIFCSGQLGLDPTTMKFPEAEGEEGNLQAQTRLALSNIAGILHAGGSDVTKIVKVTILLRKMEHFGIVDAIYKEFVTAGGNVPPARATFAVAGLPKDGLIEIEAIALA